MDPPTAAMNGPPSSLVPATDTSKIISVIILSYHCTSKKAMGSYDSHLIALPRNTSKISCDLGILLSPLRLTWRMRMRVLCGIICEISIGVDYHTH